MKIPRVLIAGVRGGGGKTLVALGLTAAWCRQHLRVACFKKGPDYIDAAWLTTAAGSPCRNLDLFLMSPGTAARSFARAATGADVAVIEGNRGLHDGMDAEGSYSTGVLAKLLQTPVVLVVDCTKATRTVAAVVLGCQRLDPEVPVRGVVLNQVGGRRHESILRDAVERVCGLPVLGVVPRMPGALLPERHLGLVPPPEHAQRDEAILNLADVADRHLDLAAIRSLAGEAPDLEIEARAPTAKLPQTVRIGVFRDAAFQFYYPENLEALTRAGARLIEISPLRDTAVPDVDALYIGGGFPETLAPELARNTPFLDSVRRLAEAGLPVYAECGGAVFLGERLQYDGNQYDMAAVLPAAFAFGPKPQGHGYVELDTVDDNPFFSVGETLRGHEFHYTSMQTSAVKDLAFAFQVRRGHGFDGQRDGLCHRNVLACYTHVHALGVEQWAPSVVRAAVRYNHARQ
ncbi:MAG: cobyrinate a,c-diamide synthase [Planctomycetota bacterium]